MRNGSKYQVKISATSSSTIAMPTLASSEGKIFTRNANRVGIDHHEVDEVDRHQQHGVLELRQQDQQREPGKRHRGGDRRPANSTIQQKLKKAQERRNASARTRSALGDEAGSQAPRDAAPPKARCARPARGRPRRSDRRVVREAIAGGMAFCRTRARLLQSPPGGGRCHQTVIEGSWQGRGRFAAVYAAPAVNAQAGAAKFIA